MKEILKGIVKASPDGLIEQIKVYFSSDKVLEEPQNHPSVIDASQDDATGVKKSMEYIEKLEKTCKELLIKLGVNGLVV